MLCVVLTEYEIFQASVLIHDGKGIELMLPDDIVCNLQGGSFGCGDELCKRRHEVLDLLGRFHAAHAVISAGNDTEQLAVRRSVLGHRHGGVSLLLRERKNVRQGVLGGEIGVADNEACLIIFHAGNHSRLVFNGLRAVNKGKPAFLRKSNGESVVRNRLHDCTRHGNVQANGAFLFALSVFHERRAKRNVCRDASFVGVSGDQKILAEGMRGFGKIGCHKRTPFVIFFITLHFIIRGRDLSREKGKVYFGVFVFFFFFSP